MAELGRTVSTADSLKKKIAAGKATVRRKYKSCKTAAKKLASSRNHLLETEAKKESKRTSSAYARLAVAENRYCAALKEYKSYLSLYDALVDDVLKLYDELVMAENAKGAQRARIAAEKFDTQQNVLKEMLWIIVKDVDFIESAEEPKFEEQTMEKEMPKVEETAIKEDPVQPKTPPKGNNTPPPYPNYGVYNIPPYYIPPEYAYRPYPPQGVNVAPASIDISPIVENAVNVAMEKFMAALGKRVDELGGELSQNSQAAVSVVPERVLAMEESVAENEQYIIEKLASLTENLQKMSDEMAELGAAYMQLANKQKDAIELQRRINDMQRALSRELQGVQVNQKVINQDQADVSASQAELIEHQKANAENQKLICESQENIAEMQKTVIETQSAIEESMRGVLSTQKEIISAQQAVINSSSKNVDLQRELAEKQAEVTSIQKAVISEYKHISRAQRNLSNKAKPRKEETKEKEEKVTLTEAITEEILEADVAVDQISQQTQTPSIDAPIAEEIELDELNADDAFKA